MFLSSDGKAIVIPDLAEFCHANEPVPIGASTETLWRAEGRRDVWLRIRQMLDMSDDELAELFRSRSQISKQMEIANG